MKLQGKATKSTELYHSSSSNNKVQFCEFCRFIPKGKKCIISFSNENNVLSCNITIVEPKTHKVVSNIKHTICAFNENLANGPKGTSCYGTILHIKNIFFVSLEDVLYYKSNKCSNMTWINKYKLLIDIINSVSKNVYSKNSVVLGLPVTRKTKEELLSEETNIPYPIFSIEYLQGYKKYYNRYESHNKMFKELILRADIKSDIYHVFDTNYLGKACIPDFKTSVMMNSYFRNITENIDIDRIEESDDDEEFENTNIDKFVDTNKCILFRCKLNQMFQQWTPIEYIGEK